MTLAPAADHPELALDRTLASLRSATGLIAPLWSLDHFVAVNPYLGMTDRSLDAVADRLSRVAGARSTLPIGDYLDAVDRGEITRDDIAAALAAHDGPAPAADVDDLLRTVATDGEPQASVPTVADVAEAAAGWDLGRLMVDRVSAWASAYFDAGQASWRSAASDAPLFEAWRFEAERDRTPEIAGLRGFRAFVRSLPADPKLAAHHALTELGVPAEALDLYLHRVLLRVGGWSAHLAHRVFDASLDGAEDDVLVDFLAVLVCWELGLLRTTPTPTIASDWHRACDELERQAHESVPSPELSRRLVLHAAFERAHQRAVIDALHGADASAAPVDATRPLVQTVSCIDVRSEVLRRHLEAVADGVQTLGFAGFFGFPIEYVPIGQEQGSAQCPALLRPKQTVREAVIDGRTTEAADARALVHAVRRAWKGFKGGAVSCFAFVSPLGLAYLPKLLSDAFGRTRPVASPDADALPSWARSATGPGAAELQTIPLEDRAAIAEGALRGMSLTSGFAPIVLLAGHGATTTNNPYDSGLDCGACGGHSGEANARVAAAVLNDAEVRAVLAGRGVAVPADTWFVAAQHDTTTDEVTVFDRDLVPASHGTLLATLEGQLAEAGRRARAERAPRLGLSDSTDVDADVRQRSIDWAQVRPEWGLAGCRAFVVAPRHRTVGVDLEGRAFLHSYDWRQDDGFGVLELIMSAPMVVASWISLQYYGSTVDNDLFGSGNKTLHNVVGRSGVLEGFGGDLRVGLPLQSVHDGTRRQHDPVRLNVVIEAPIDAMNRVIDTNDAVRDLCDNGWVQLLAMDDTGRVAARYAGGFTWEPIDAREDAVV